MTIVVTFFQYLFQLFVVVSDCFCTSDKNISFGGWVCTEFYKWLTCNVSLERSKSVPIDSPYGLGNLLLPVMLFYHPSMKSLVENIHLQVERRKMEDVNISVC